MSERCRRMLSFRSLAALSRGWGAVLITVVALSGCATRPITAITLSGVVRGDVTYSGVVPADVVQLTRGNQTYRVTPEMLLEPGDMLRTGHDAGAVVSYPGGARAYVYPNTQVRIGSIIDDFGKVFVKVKGVFKVKTSFVTAGSEGTQYWVNVAGRDDVKVVVVEDVVNLESSNDAWPAWRLQANQQAVFRGAARGVMSPADAAEIRRETDWVRSMDQRVPVKMSVNKTAVLVGVIAAGIAVGIFESGKSDPPPQRPYGR